MDWNLISLWTRRAPAGELPSSIAGDAEMSLLAAVIPSPGEVTEATVEDDAATPLLAEYTELECICGETHPGWTHRDAAQTDEATAEVLTGPLHDRIRQAAYSAYRHSATECVCGATHAGWDHREAPRPIEPIFAIRQYVLSRDVSSDTPKRVRRGRATTSTRRRSTRVEVETRPAPNSKKPRNGSRSGSPRRARVAA